MKYIITGLGEGTYDSLNPITDGNLVEFGGAKPDTEISWSEINNKPTIPSVLDVLNSTRKDASLSADRGRVLKGLFDKLEDVLDIDEMINAVRNITLRNNGDISSGLYIYDNPTTETLYQFVRYNAASNFVEFGSNDGDGEVISAKVDRGKPDWEFQDRIQIMKPGRGVSFLTPSATNLDGNSSADKYELIVNEGGVLELYNLDNTSLASLVWSSSSVTAKKVDTDFDLSKLGSYASDSEADTGGVAIGFAYINSSTGAMHRRLT